VKEKGGGAGLARSLEGSSSIKSEAGKRHKVLLSLSLFLQWDQK
jgi:hypothetical protein